jgi:putative transferase (TIGR04331 family)
MIYSQLLQEYFKENNIIKYVRKKNDKSQQLLKVNRTFRSLLSPLKRLVISLSIDFKNWIQNSDKYFFIKTYLPLSIENELLLRLGQKPKKWKLAPTPKSQMNYKMRELELKMDSLTDDFSNILSQMIPKHIPTAYLEGYQSLLACTEYLGWPQRPKCIFTSNSYSEDDVFKAWVAEKTEHGVPLVIGQHGGHYGMTPWAFEEEHQISISDAWISWGWSDEKKPQIIPMGNFKTIGHAAVDYDPNGMALMISMTLPRYSYHMYAIPVAGQWLSYFRDQCIFISALPESIRQQVLLRPKVNDYGWYQKERWEESFPNIELDDGQEPIYNLVNKSRLFISTYNATTFLESLSWNMPTIIFWNPNHWELKEDALPYFELLKSVNIFHETPESAANHMMEIWDDIPAWWESKSVQHNRKQFCDRYSHIPEKPLDELLTIFNKFSRATKHE